jgi:hypothetical protein
MQGLAFLFCFLAFFVWCASYSHWITHYDEPYGATLSGWTALLSFVSMVIVGWLAF